MNNENIVTSKSENLPKILYLIIYDEQTQYEVKMKEILEKYIHNFENIKSYFIILKELDKDYVIHNNILYIKGKESRRPGILYKTIQAMKILEYNKYDYIIRGNISTVIDLGKLYEILKNEKRKNIYGDLKNILIL